MLEFDNVIVVLGYYSFPNLHHLYPAALVSGLDTTASTANINDDTILDSSESYIISPSLSDTLSYLNNLTTSFQRMSISTLVFSLNF